MCMLKRAEVTGDLSIIKGLHVLNFLPFQYLQLKEVECNKYGIKTFSQTVFGIINSHTKT